MNQAMLAGMHEATRLTRAGQLNEATAMIQRTLRGEAAADPVAQPEEHWAKAPIEGSFRVVNDGGAEPSAKTERTERRPVYPFDTRDSLLQGFELPSLRPQRRRHAPTDLIPDGGRFIDGSYGNQAGTRSYKLYIPSSYRGQALPLVLMLHGCTQDPDDFAAGTRMNHLAEAQDCLVLYPAQSPGANLQKCWNWFRNGDQQRDGGEPSLLAGMTREVITRYGLDQRRVYVAGLSSGGAMAAILGATHPDLYAAVGIHSGLAAGAAGDLPSAFAAMRQGGAGFGPADYRVPTIVFHGDSDTTVHPRNGELVIAQATAGATTGGKPRVSKHRGQVPGGHAYTRAVYVDPDGGVFMEHWLIHGAGHAWAGGSDSGSYTDPKGPDATCEMLRFFSQQVLAAAC
ncbi:poly(hydroxyalkanoate) depolymerase family esterase [Natronocella acetinitrilica]|uniref:Poly(Hydroxyalkanoate) depolymerase family esterase n=1 Tax=Natronocella acetinitrilica TaxID=414046 RepID=A0AAE3G646_9GAMM|nr:PHB depolymerase family esterase [Natronocella acetinitrilica]MCP1675416.1 poly(hydroxyalkanoate) depolymerase family esterase [Natronocella acetinitrilica]